MGRIIFITGGARSGKSSFALAAAEKFSGKKAFIATLEPLDNEMIARIERHRRDRGPEWETFEEPIEVAPLLGLLTGHRAVVLDCLTLWIANLMARQRDVEKETQILLSAARACSCPLFMVANEVGMGIVPENEMARQFRDLAGFANQKIAAAADEVYLVVAGIPIKIKEL